MLLLVKVCFIGLEEKHVFAGQQLFHHHVFVGQQSIFVGQISRLSLKKSQYVPNPLSVKVAL